MKLHHLHVQKENSHIEKSNCDAYFTYLVMQWLPCFCSETELAKKKPVICLVGVYSVYLMYTTSNIKYYEVLFLIESHSRNYLQSSAYS